MLLRHQAGARLVGQYDANNTYQYIVNREDVQLTWVATAIEELGGSRARRVAAVARRGRQEGATPRSAVIEEDAARRAGVRRPLAPAHRADDQRPAREDAARHPRRRRSSRSGSSSRRWPAGSIFSAGAASSSSRRTAKCCRPGGSSSRRARQQPRRPARPPRLRRRRLCTTCSPTSRCPRYYDTVPVGVAGPQPLFLNAAAVGRHAAVGAGAARRAARDRAASAGASARTRTRRGRSIWI